MTRNTTLCSILTAITLSSCANINKQPCTSSLIQKGNVPQITKKTFEGEIFAKIVIPETKDDKIKTYILIRSYNQSGKYYEISTLNSDNSKSDFFYQDNNNGLNILRQLNETYKISEMYYKNILPNSTLAPLPKEILEKYTQKPKTQIILSFPPSDIKDYPQYDLDEKSVLELNAKLEKRGLKIMCY